MGWTCSWIGVRCASKADVLQTLGFLETEQLVEPGSGASKWSVSDVDNGWVIVFSEDFEWADPALVVKLSAHGLVVGLQFEDRVEMTSIACAAQDGVELWRVSHVYSENAQEALVVTGDPPAILATIRDELLAEQANDKDDSVDYLHDVPIRLAKWVSGYRVDDWLPPFIALRKSGAPPAGETRAEGGALMGLLKRLFTGQR